MYFQECDVSPRSQVEVELAQVYYLISLFFFNYKIHLSSSRATEAHEFHHIQSSAGALIAAAVFNPLKLERHHFSHAAFRHLLQVFKYVRLYKKHRKKGSEQLDTCPTACKRSIQIYNI